MELCDSSIVGRDHWCRNHQNLTHLHPGLCELPIPLTIPCAWMLTLTSPRWVVANSATAWSTVLIVVVPRAAATRHQDRRRLNHRRRKIISQGLLARFQPHLLQNISSAENFSFLGRQLSTLAELPATAIRLGYLTKCRITISPTLCPHGYFQVSVSPILILHGDYHRRHSA